MPDLNLYITRLYKIFDLSLLVNKTFNLIRTYVSIIFYLDKVLSIQVIKLERKKKKIKCKCQYSAQILEILNHKELFQ